MFVHLCIAALANMTTGPLRLAVEHDRPFRVDSTRKPVTTAGPFGVEPRHLSNLLKHFPVNFCSHLKKQTKWLPAGQARSVCNAIVLQVVVCSFFRPGTALIDRGPRVSEKTRRVVDHLGICLCNSDLGSVPRPAGR